LDYVDDETIEAVRSFVPQRKTNVGIGTLVVPPLRSNIRSI